MLGVTKIVNQGTDYRSVFYIISNISFWTDNDTNFPKVTRIMSLLIHHFRFSVFVLETLKLEWQCSQYLELNPTCVLANSGYVLYGLETTNLTVIDSVFSECRYLLHLL